MYNIPPGTKEEMNVIVEINKGSHNKYEIDKKTGIIALDRVLHTSQEYPFDYGFIPQTLWEDGDPLDVILLTSFPIHPGILVKARPVGLMHMIDSGDSDDKVIAVPVHDPRWDHIKDLDNINKHTLKEMAHFYSTYKNLQNKEVNISGFKTRIEAEEAFIKACASYTPIIG